MKEAVFSRHSVRKYTDKKLPGEVIEKLNGLIEEYNAEGGLSIRLVTDEPKSFSGFQGKPHRSKPLSSLCRCEGEMPEWFRRGMEFVCQAPTAMNQQRFLFTLSGGKVNARSKGGSCAKIDLGIAKLHFELGAGKENFEWA